MTPNFHSPLPSFHDLHEDQNHHFLSLKPQRSSSSSSSLSSHIFFNPDQDHHQYYRQEADMHVPHGESCDPSTVKQETDMNCLNLTLWTNKEDRNEINQSEHTSSPRWMSSKMRLMRKMMKSDPTAMHTTRSSMQKFEEPKQPPSPSETDYSCNNNIRVCADCNTTKTPLWRSGPRGPKSLCNACGIRQRKARRAIAAAAAAANGAVMAPDTSSIKNKAHHKDKKSSNSYLPFKKRGKITAQHPRGGKKKSLCFDDLMIILSKNSAFHRVFPQDEKEAAMLLMALSYGLVHG